MWSNYHFYYIKKREIQQYLYEPYYYRSKTVLFRMTGTYIYKMQQFDITENDMNEVTLR